eukprot:TRINITY_DN571_c0_g2_i2.p1 TRINITY_DN571_c0_g2~~TRINITY_DN571_c0_g2_i2.p1  ORF type:complete len:366 (-),score=68.82 TRINITY_DN571_c0_g2_i2:259-1356(-)
MVMKLGVLFPGRTPDAPAEANKIIGNYKLGKTIGEGSYGKVRMASHLQTGVEYAVKSYDRRKMGHDDLKRVQSEINVLKTLSQHQNVIRLVDHIESGTMIYLVMELAQDGDLLDFTDERDFIDENVARPIFMQIAEAIYYCHQHKILHRDLKLENVLLTGGDKIAKVSDFGLSCIERSDDSHVICGTPVYRAPEMIQNRSYSFPVDVWALGVILYSMLHGQFPFYDENINILNHKINTASYAKPTRGSPQAHDLIRRMLTVDPAARISIRDVLRHPWLHMKDPQQVLSPQVAQLSETRERRASSLFRVNQGPQTLSFRQRRPSMVKREGPVLEFALSDGQNGDELMIPNVESRIASLNAVREVDD